MSMVVYVIFWFLLFVILVSLAFLSYGIYGRQVACQNDKCLFAKKDSMWKQTFDSSVFIFILYEILHWFRCLSIVRGFLDFCHRYLICEMLSKLFSMYIIPSLLLLGWYASFFIWIVQMAFGAILVELGVDGMFEIVLAGVTICGAYLVGCFKVFDKVVADYRKD